MVTKRVLHLANTKSVNIGNGALILGTERVLNEDLDWPIEWHRLSWDDYTFGRLPFDEKFVERLNEHDLCLINGAVTFNGRAYLNQAGMRFDLPYHLWESIKVPLVFYGLSYRVWEGQPYHHREKLIAAITKILEHPKRILAVRNDGTQAWLSQLTGFPKDCFPEIPDPALFVPYAENVSFAEFSATKLNYLLALNNEDHAQRFQKRNSYKYLVSELAHFFSELSQSLEFQLILVPHYFDDLEMFSHFIQKCDPKFAHQCVTLSGLTPLSDTQRFYARYHQADAAFSMRVHSISPSIGVGTPVIPIITQPRISEFLNSAKLTEHSVNAFEQNLSTALKSKLNQLNSNRHHWIEKQNSAKKLFKKELNKFNTDSVIPALN